MSFRGLARDLRDSIGSLSRRSFDFRLRGKSHAAVYELHDQPEVFQSSCWAELPLELLRDVIQRLEENESTWPARKHVVACAAVCRSWRVMCKEIVRCPEISGKLTFPISLKQPGYRDGTIQCFIKRNKSNLTYNLFLCLSPVLLLENGKFLLSAKRNRRTTCTEYVISTDADNISRSSSSYIGKVRSNFLGTKFIIYDTQPPPAAATLPGHTSRRFTSTRVSPKPPSGNYTIAQITYELNVLGTRGPRRMHCSIFSIPASALKPGGFVPARPDNLLSGPLEDDKSEFGSARFSDMAGPLGDEDGNNRNDASRPLVLKNKAPRWHEQLQCWCLNFRGRVTVASVKNFQLVAAGPPAPPPQRNGPSSSSDQDKILLQFGKDARMDDVQSDAYQSSRSSLLVSAWRGSFNIPRQNLSINVAAHVLNNACLEVASIMPESLCLEIVRRIDIWPASFKSSPPDEHSVALFFFPEGRDEEVFNNLLTYAMSGDFSLKATIGKAELLIFTSFQLPGKLHRFQGKPYLWGVFNGPRVGASHRSEHQLHIQTPIVRLSLSANSCAQRSFDGREGSGTISSEHSSLNQAPKVDRRGRRLDDGWQHANSLDPLKQKAECKYCGFVSSHGGISRLKAHLGGGHPKIRLPGCQRVPPEVEKIMSDWFNDWVCKTKALWTKEVRAEIGAHDERENPHDAAVWEDRTRDFNGCFSFDLSQNEISHKISGGGAHIAQWEVGPKFSPGTRGVKSVKVKNLKSSISSETKGVISGWLKSPSSFKLKESQGNEQSDRRGRPLDNAWQHAKALDETRQKTQCNYCGFISMYGGISRLKAHLGGGSPEMQLQGCPRVSLEIKTMMEEWYNEWVKYASATWTRKSNERVPLSKSVKRGRPLEDTWDHVVPLDESRQATECKYCGLVSRRGGIARMRAHLGGGDLTMQLESCPYVPPEVKSSMMPTLQKKKYKKKSKAEHMGAAFEGAQETSSMANKAHWFERRHHILQETPAGVHNMCLKEGLQKLIHEKNANLQKMQYEIHSLQNQLASMP